MASAFAQFAPEQSQVSPDEALLSQFRSVSAHALESNPVDSITSALAGQDKPSQGLLDLADKAVNNQLPPSFPPPAMIHPSLMDNASMFDLATLSGMPPDAAMNLAGRSAIGEMNPAKDFSANISREFNQNFGQHVINQSAGNLIANSGPGIFNADTLQAATTNAFGGDLGKGIFDKVSSTLQDKDDEGILSPDVADAGALFGMGRTASISEMMKNEEIRNWVEDSAKLVKAGEAYSLPEGSWWEAMGILEEGEMLQRWLGEEVFRMGNPDVDFGDPSDAGWTGKLPSADPASGPYNPAPPFQPGFTEPYRPRSGVWEDFGHMPGEYAMWDTGSPGDQERIYRSIVLRGLPRNRASLPYITDAVNSRFETVKGAYLLSDFYDNTIARHPDLATMESLGGASPFAQFVLKEGSPFKMGVTPEDTRAAFRDYVTASSLSPTDYYKRMGAKYPEWIESLEAEGETQDFQDYAQSFDRDQHLAFKVSPFSPYYEVENERAILKAQAGWTGTGERGRLREQVLDRLYRDYVIKRQDPGYIEGFIAFAASVKGSPWYKAVHGNN